MFSRLIFITLIFLCHTALSFDTKKILRKGSILLRGKPPTTAEYKELEEAILKTDDEHKKREILINYFKHYMKSPDFFDVIHSEVAGWTNLNNTESNYELAYRIAHNHKIKGIFSKKTIWLNATRLNQYLGYGTEFMEPTDLIFSGWQKFTFANEELRFSSILGHLDFLERFPDTPTNKNRARVSRVYTSYFCNQLNPQEPTGVDLTKLHLDSEHGTEANCIGCHYRLDPMARLFDRWQPPNPNSTLPTYNSAMPARGEFVYALGNGQHYIKEAVDISGLSMLLEKNEGIDKCFVKRAWDFVMGSSSKIDREIENELIVKIKSNENFQELIIELLNTDYFIDDKPLPQNQYSDIQENFKICQDCHAESGSTITKIDFKNYPYRANSDENFELMKILWHSINGSTGALLMPPKNSGLQPLSSTATNLIKDWIINGAPVNDLSTLNDQQIEEIFKN